MNAYILIHCMIRNKQLKKMQLPVGTFFFSYYFMNTSNILLCLLTQVLDATDHINSCKPVNRTDPSYTETLNFLQKLKDHYT